jgi:malectin (di-glucose binding ER protein)/glycosyl hydrolase family 26
MRFLSAAAFSFALLGSSVAFFVSGFSASEVEAQSAPSVYWGAYMDGAPFDTTAMDRFEADAGRKESVVHWGEPWQMNGQMMAFQTAQYEAVRLRGAIPMIDWLSWNLGAPIDDPNYSLAKIYNGTYDSYIRSWATAAKAWGHPFFVRFDHEMNGNWYPWSELRNGNHTGDFVRAWRHVHDIFTSVGATNATWVWTINGVYGTSIPLPGLYPGDSYVDWTGMDAYNRASGPTSWLTFNQVFGDNPWSHMNTYTQLLAVAPTKPIAIAETATSIYGGDAGAWITDALQTQLPRYFPQVKALVWTNTNFGDPTLTWPIETTSGQLNAFRSSINDGYFAANSFANLPFGPVQALGSATAPAPAPAPPPSSTAPSTYQIRVRAGGAEYHSPDGRSWEADTAYSGGGTYATSASIAKTPDPALYQGTRYGNFSYNFSVPNGTYTVDLKFAEVWWTAAGKRVFNVGINGQQVLTNFDILAQAGGANRATDKTFTTSVTNGRLAITFTSVVDNAQINAIEILPGVPTRINAGAAAYTGPDGQTWQADTGFSGGATSWSGVGIGNSLDSALYDSARFGNFTYAVNVPNGVYRVVLKFAETYWSSAGRRVFNVSINNTRVLSNFDIFAQASGADSSVDRTFQVTVTNGTVSIAFSTITDNAQVNAIEIQPGQ